MNILWSLLSIFFHSKAVSQELSHTKWTKELPESIIIYEGEIFSVDLECHDCNKPPCYLNEMLLPTSNVHYEQDIVLIRFFARAKFMNYTYEHNLKCTTVSEVNGEHIEDSTSIVVHFRIIPIWMPTEYKYQTKRAERFQFTAKYNATKELPLTINCTKEPELTEVVEFSHSEVDGEMTICSREPLYKTLYVYCDLGDGNKTSSIGLSKMITIIKNPAAVTKLTFSPINRAFINEEVTLHGEFKPLENGQNFSCENAKQTFNESGTTGNGIFSLKIPLKSEELFDTYKCKVENVDGSEGYGNVTVFLEQRFSPPKWKKTPSSVIPAPIGQVNFKIEMVLEAPDSSVEANCTKNDTIKRLLSEHSQTNSSMEKLYVLIFDQIEESDYGKYSCKAISTDGSEEFQFELMRPVTKDEKEDQEEEEDDEEENDPQGYSMEAKGLQNVGHWSFFHPGLIVIFNMNIHRL